MKRLRALSFAILFLMPLVLRAQTQLPTAPGTVTVQDLMSAENRKMIGKSVTLWYQPVQVKTGDAFWVGPSRQEMVLVAVPGVVRVLDGSGRPVKLNKGDYVQVKGIVVTAPDDSQLRAGWGVNKDHLPLVRRAGVIILAQNITLVRQND